jgi:ABC-type branched-subunit amino acid transport system ATPase component
MTLLNVHRISKSFGGVAAVRDVSLTVSPGELVALIGPNGAGKSTTFNMINGQLVPDSGDIEVSGRSIRQMAPYDIWRAGVGRTFQTAAVFGSMTVLENIQTVLLSHDKKLWRCIMRASHYRYADAMEVLGLVGLESHAHESTQHLAYADLKRVELAMAIASQPALLLMDEPTAGMAPSERLAMMELTTQLVRQRQMGVLFTEHSMDVVFGYADRIIVMAQGQIIGQGTPEQVQADVRVKQAYFGVDGIKETRESCLNVTRGAEVQGR